MRAIAVGVIVAAGVFAAPASSEEAKPSALIYSPWTKFCLKEICFIGADGRIAPDCAPRVAAVVIERRAETKKTLRVTVPTSVDRQRGVSISIDGTLPVERPYVQCFANGCMADYEAGPELIDRIKQGQKLVVEATDAGNSAIRFTLPLAGFAAAYEGPAQQPPAFKVVSPQEMLEDEARQAREKAEREARCGAK